MAPAGSDDPFSFRWSAVQGGRHLVGTLVATRGKVDPDLVRAGKAKGKLIFRFEADDDRGRRDVLRGQAQDISTLAGQIARAREKPLLAVDDSVDAIGNVTINYPTTVGLLLNDTSLGVEASYPFGPVTLGIPYVEFDVPLAASLLQALPRTCRATSSGVRPSRAVHSIALVVGPTGRCRTRAPVPA